jgi:FtsP/CotA-like multicopper oxidase with cupredoxin domain
LNVAARRGEREATFAVVVAILAVVAAVIAGALAVRAIRDDDTAGARSRGNGASTVDVTLTEFAITPAEITVGAGGALRVTNDGSIEHNLAVEGADLRTPMLGAGGSATLELGALAPGTYALLCEVGGHAGAGMSGKLIVTEGGSGSDVPAAGGGDPDWAAMDKAMTESMLAFPATTEGKGAQVLAPTVLPNGIKQFEVTAAITEWEVSPGQLVEAWTYNGQVPGPTLRVAVGDEIQVVVRNDLPMGTDVHWHGVETPNEMDGVAPITQKLIGPGETFVYTFTATEPAVGMYHAHHHAQMQVINGMLGALIVGDLELPRGQTISGEAIPADLQVSQEFPLVLNDAGVIGLSLNGKSFPATEPVAAKLGDWLLVHYMNEGLQSHPMHLHQMEQLVVAKDGIPLDNPYFADTINVAPGERYSVLVHADSVGTWVWHCHILNHVEQEDGMFGMVTAMVVTP